jgi:hypothetical protein
MTSLSILKIVMMFLLRMVPTMATQARAPVPAKKGCNNTKRKGDIHPKSYQLFEVSGQNAERRENDASNRLIVCFGIIWLVIKSEDLYASPYYCTSSLLNNKVGTRPYREFSLSRVEFQNNGYVLVMVAGDWD